MDGLIFDLAEGAVHDGPGLRVTVFLKGCPLRCRWCHSPEGQSAVPETLRTATGARRCGDVWSDAELAAYLLRTAALLGPSGGVTFSGGDPLAQAAFVEAVLARLDGVHTIVETAGFGDTNALLALARRASFLHFGLKLTEDAASREWLGVPAAPILDNLTALDRADCVDYAFRLPLLRGITDAPENLRGLMALSGTLRRLRRIDFLPANRLAPGKYAACGRSFPGTAACLATGTVPSWFAPSVPWAVLQ